MFRFIKLVIILLCIAFFVIPTFFDVSKGLSAGNNTKSEVKSPIPTIGLKVKSFRRGTAYGIARAVNEWIKNNPEVHIYHIQSHSSFWVSELYIWYK